MKTPLIPAGLSIAALSFFASNCLALTPFSDNFNASKLDTVNWQPGAYGTGAKLKQSGGRLVFTMPVAKSREVDAWLELATSRPGYNENWQAILDVTNANEHQGDSAVGFWIFNSADPSDAVFLEFSGKGAKGGFAASFVLDGKYNVGAAIKANPAVGKGSIRILFNKTSKILTFSYDPTGSVDGYQWTRLATFATNGIGGDRRGNWEMDPEIGTFTVRINGYVEGKVVASGTETMDNFVLKSVK
ncbi:MAG: hypothetical protein V4689_13665 [Verrucomicrobiota bacterium]